jgi:hypothetical protein
LSIIIWWNYPVLTGVKLKLFCPEAKNSFPLFKFIELWGADLVEWGAILVEVIKIKSKVGHHDILKVKCKIDCTKKLGNRKNTLTVPNPCVSELYTPPRGTEKKFYSLPSLPPSIP